MADEARIPNNDHAVAVKIRHHLAAGQSLDDDALRSGFDEAPRNELNRSPRLDQVALLEFGHAALAILYPEDYLRALLSLGSSSDSSTAPSASSSFSMSSRRFSFNSGVSSPAST